MSWAYIPGSMLRDPEFLARLAEETKNEEPYKSAYETEIEDLVSDPDRPHTMTPEEYARAFDAENNVPDKVKEAVESSGTEYPNYTYAETPAAQFAFSGPGPCVRGGFISTPTQHDLDLLIAQNQSLVAANARIGALQTQTKERLASVTKQAEQYRADLREYILDLMSNGEIDERVAAEFLDNMGLDGIARKYKVEIGFTLSTVIEVEASTEDEATDKVLDMTPKQIIREQGIDMDDFDFDIGDVRSTL